jgi:hypothetical protein
MDALHTTPATRPVRTFDGLNSRIELYPDHITIHRNDPIAQVMPWLFDHKREIPLDRITACHIHESEYTYSAWYLLTLAVQGAPPVPAIYLAKDQAQAYEFKNAIDDYISKKELFPPAREAEAH